MRSFEVIKLGTECRDNATKLEGTVTHWFIFHDLHIQYLFQPKGLDEEGQPLKKIGLAKERLTVGKDAFETVDIPIEIIGTTVTDKASGFTGMAIALIRHINGCFHVEIQPEGTSKKSHGRIDSNDFDLRGCVGEMIPQLTAEEKKESEVRRPSPSPASRTYGIVERY